ncbi:hypothetical protein KSW81_002908 [Nannochloris sp. 'desiccata']|nr:hypothetical protein KSW81_002908 [Chlorella desiccata (nom. nud.)]
MGVPASPSHDRSSLRITFTPTAPPHLVATAAPVVQNNTQAPYSRGIRVEDLQRYICDLWRPLMAGIDAYSPPEKCSGPGRPKRHDHSGITLKIVKVALGNKFSIDEAEFLLAKMDSNPDFAGLTWFTPAKTIRNRTKATILYNAYHDPALPLPEKIKPAKRAPAGHTWESAYPAHPNWDQHVHIIAKSIMAVEATMATDGEIFNAIEMACKAVALWDTIHPDEFAEYMKKKGKTKNKRKRAREAQGSENAVSVPCASSCYRGYYCCSTQAAALQDQQHSNS